MKTSYKSPAADAAAVDVKFVHAGVTHTRPVNVCRDATGAFDKAAMDKRVDEVALGVERKINVGAVINPPPVPEIAVPPVEPALDA